MIQKQRSKAFITIIILIISISIILLAREYETALFITKMPLFQKSQVNSTALQNYSSPVLTALPVGRLGNQMGEYGTIFCYHKMYNTKVVLHPEMSKKLQGHFKNLTVKEMEGFESVKWKNIAHQKTIYNYENINKAASGMLGNGYFVTVDFPFELNLFQQFKSELLQEFQFDDRYIQKADKFLSSAKDIFYSNKDPSIITYIGFHIRRGDYAGHMKTFGGELPGLSYFTKALNYYKNIFSHVIYILATNDRPFAEETFKNEKHLIISKDNDPFEDLALLTRCNNSIITLGSFGFWGGFLANGTVVYPDITTKKEYRFCKEKYEAAKMTNFIPLSVD